MESLSQEILLLIIPYLCREPPILRLNPWIQRWQQMPTLDIASYATISRPWQYAVERFTMADIQKHSSDLLIERHKERDVDDKAFEKGIIDLFNELSTWDKQDLRLTVATSYLSRRPLDFDMGLGPMRTDIYLSSDNADLPELPRIRSLYIPDVRRNLHPSMIGWIISSLPRLENLMLKLNAPPPKNKEIQKEYRLALAKALDSPSLSNLRSLCIFLTESIPVNHSYETQTEDPVYPDGDALNLSIRKLAETSPLAALNLTGSWLISPALFNGTAPFPYLQDVNIDAAILTYEGRWYYTGDPSSVVRRFQLGTHEPEQGEAMLNGRQPRHQWRTEPDSEILGALMKSMADAMNQMPRLLRLKFSMAMDRTGDPEIIFTYSETRPAVRHIELGRAAKWEVPDEILKLWRERSGGEGVNLREFKWLTGQVDQLYLKNY